MQGSPSPCGLNSQLYRFLVDCHASSLICFRFSERSPREGRLQSAGGWFLVLMATDESFKRPGAIPFKWEIKPGVPKSAPDDPPTQPRPHKSWRLPCNPSSGPVAGSLPPSHSWLSGLKHERYADAARRNDVVVPPGSRKHVEKSTFAHRVGNSEDSEDDDSDFIVADSETLARWSMSAWKNGCDIEPSSLHEQIGTKR